MGCGDFFHLYFAGVGLLVVQSLSHVLLFAAPWTAACQASLSSTVSQSLLRFMSIESMMLSNHLILGCPLLRLPSVFSSASCGTFFIGAHSMWKSQFPDQWLNPCPTPHCKTDSQPLGHPPPFLSCSFLKCQSIGPSRGFKLINIRALHNDEDYKIEEYQGCRI